MIRNDKEFREKCREISNANVNRFIHNGDIAGSGLMMCDREDAETLKTSALLYIAASMPSPNERAKKPCELCNDNAEHDRTISHYLYIDSIQKQLVDVCDGEETRVAIRYCLNCGREL